MSFFLARCNKSYFDFEKAFVNESVFMKRSNVNAKIGDRFLVMFSGRKGIGYIGTILSKKKEYFDDDVLETNLGVEKIGRKKCIGYEVRLVERVDISHQKVMSILNLNLVGGWTWKKISENEYNEIITE